MNRDAMWTLFEKTGNIDAYMIYHNLAENSASNKQEVLANAIKDRRTDHSGSECR